MARIGPVLNLAHRVHIQAAMGAFEDLLKKQGYVKLDRYGLVLTDDDRILSTRPAVLDDGLGGKIVGWADGDLAAAELEVYGAAKKPAAAAKVAANTGLQSRPPAPPAPPRVPGVRVTAPMAVVAAPAPVAPPRIAAATTPPPVAAPVVEPAPIAPPAPVVRCTASAVAKVAQVADEPELTEDEWEWEIAMARARAAAEDVQTAASTIASGFTKPSAPKKTQPMTAVAPRALAQGSGPTAKPDPMSAWPTTEPLGELQDSWADATRENAPQVMSPVAKQIAVAKSAVRVNTPVTPVAVPLFEAAVGSAPTQQPSRTVIPVPQLPVAAKPSDVRPAFNPGQPPPRLAAKRAQPNVRSRIARGTEPQKAQEDATVVTAAVQPANDELTSPYVTLPSEVKPTGFAHTKRVAAKHR